MELSWSETKANSVQNKEAENPDAPTALFIRPVVSSGRDPAGQQLESRIELVVMCHGLTIPGRRKLREYCLRLLIRRESFRCHDRIAASSRSESFPANGRAELRLHDVRCSFLEHRSNLPWLAFPLACSWKELPREYEYEDKYSSSVDKPEKEPLMLPPSAPRVQSSCH